LTLAFFIPFVVYDIMKQMKRFKTDGTKEVYNSINRMMIMAVVLILFFVITKQNHL